MSSFFDMTSDFDWAGDGSNGSGDGSKFLAQLLARIPSEDDDDSGDVHFRWGTSSGLQADLMGGQFLPSITTVNWPTFPGGPTEEDKMPVYTFQEMGRVEHTVKITNPEDDEQYVYFKLIDEISFQGSDGKLVKFVLHNPTDAG